MMPDGKHAIVTGGGTGVGAKIAETLAHAGTRVTMMGRREAPLREVGGDRAVAVFGPGPVGERSSAQPVRWGDMTTRSKVEYPEPLSKDRLRLWLKLLKASRVIEDEDASFLSYYPILLSHRHCREHSQGSPTAFTRRGESSEDF